VRDFAVNEVTVIALGFHLGKLVTLNHGDGYRMFAGVLLDSGIRTGTEKLGRGQNKINGRDNHFVDFIGRLRSDRPNAPAVIVLLETGGTGTGDFDRSADTANIGA